jgi:6-phosphogluconolactonase
VRGSNPRHLFLGCYTEGTQEGRGTGIAVYRLDDDGALSGDPLVVPAASPSFLALAPDRLFAVHEELRGGVSTFERSGGSLTALQTVPTGGAEPCHLVHDAAGGRLLVTNYGSGSVASVGIGDLGALRSAEVIEFPPGRGPVPERQEGPHAHQFVPAETGSGAWLVADLGGDRLFEYRSSGSTLELLGEHPLPPGSGPRHMAWARGALLVGGELDSRLHVLRRAGGVLKHEGSVLTHFGQDGTESYPSHLEVAPHGRVAYLANRARDTIAVFDLEPLDRGDTPALVQEVPSGGLWPRHFALHGARLYVANQRSHEVTVFAVADPATGQLDPEPVQRVATGSPACVVLA